MSRLIMAIAVMVTSAGFVLGDEVPDEIKGRLDKARAAYKAETDKAQADLLTLIETKREAAQKAGDLAQLKKILADKEAVSERGELPKTVSSADFVAASLRAKNRMSAALTAARKEYTQAGRLAEAESADDELTKFLAGKTAKPPVDPPVKPVDPPVRPEDPKLKGVEKAKTDFEETFKAAEKKLLAAFDSEAELIPKQTALKAEAKKTALEAVALERETFEKYGTIPFSPRMRTAAIAYTASLRQAHLAAGTVFDKAIDQLTKAKDFSNAALLSAEKKKHLEPKVIGYWTCSIGFTQIFFSDGTGQNPTEPNKSTWHFEKDKLIVKNPNLTAPPGGWVVVLTFDSTGQEFDAADQRNKYKGKRTDPTKTTDPPKSGREPASDDSLQGQLATAKRAYESGLERAGVKMLEAFAEQQKQLVLSKTSKSAELLVQLKKEKAAFEVDNGYLPKSPSMKMAVDAYTEQIMTDLLNCSSAFEKIARAYRNLKNPAESDSVLREKVAFIGLLAPGKFEVICDPPLPTKCIAEFTPDHKIVMTHDNVVKGTWFQRGRVIEVAFDNKNFGMAILRVKTTDPDAIVGENVHTNGSTYKWMMTRIK